MKTNEELNTLKKEVEALNNKLADLTEEELEQVASGIAHGRPYWTGRGSGKKDNDTTDGEN